MILEIIERLASDLRINACAVSDESDFLIYGQILFEEMIITV